MPLEYQSIGSDTIRISRFLKLIYSYYADSFPCKLNVEYNDDESYYLQDGKQITETLWRNLKEVETMIDFLENALAYQHLILRKGEDHFVFCHVDQTRLFSFFHKCFILNYQEFKYLPFRNLHKNLKKSFLNALKKAYDRELEIELKKKFCKNPLLPKIFRLIKFYLKRK